MMQRKRNEIFIYGIDGSENTRRLYIGLREIQKTVLKWTGEEGRGIHMDWGVTTARRVKRESEAQITEHSKQPKLKSSSCGMS